MADLVLNNSTNVEKEDIESPRFESVANMFSGSLSAIDKELDSLLKKDEHESSSNHNHSTPKKRRVSETMIADENSDPNVKALASSGISASMSTPNRNSSSNKGDSASRVNTPNRTPLRLRRSSNNNTPISTGKSKKSGSTDFDIYDENNDRNNNDNVKKSDITTSMKGLQIDVDETILADDIPSEDLLSPKDVYPPDGEIAATGASATVDNKLNHQIIRQGMFCQVQ